MARKKIPHQKIIPDQASQKTPKNTRMFWAGIFILVAIVISCLTYWNYLPCIHGTILKNWDDDISLITNKNVTTNDRFTRWNWKDSSSIVNGHYCPVVHESWRMDFLADGEKFKPITTTSDPEYDGTTYHTTNNILAAIYVVVVFFITLLILRIPSLEPKLSHLQQLFIASGVAFLAANHPMHVESIAWITERKDIVYGTLLFVGWIITVLQLNETRMRYRLIGLTAALICFTASCLSKGQAVVFPFILILTDWFFLEDKQLFRKRLVEKIPFFIIVFFCVQQTMRGQHLLGAESSRVVAEHYSLLDRLVTLRLYALGDYIYKFFAYTNTSHYNVYPLLHGGKYSADVYGKAFLGIAFLVNLIVFRKKKLVTFSGIFFVMTILPMLQFVAMGSAITADRYTFIPYFGLSLHVLGWVLIIWQQVTTKYPSFALPVKIGIIGVLAWYFIGSAKATHERAGIWKTSISLWTDLLNKQPGLYKAHEYLGYAYYEQGNLDAALPHLKASVFSAPNVVLPRVYYSIASIYETSTTFQNFDSSIAYATEVLKRAPSYSEALMVRAVAFSRKRNFDAAMNDMNAYMKIYPTSASAHYNKALLFSEMNIPDSVLYHLNQALIYDPDSYDALRARSLAYGEKKQFGLALNDIRRFLVLRPNDAMGYFIQGQIFANTSIYDSSIISFTRSLDLNPGHGESLRNRAIMFALSGNFPAAYRDINQFIALNPDNPVGLQTKLDIGREAEKRSTR